MVKKGRKESMRTVREILRLNFEHQLSQRAIARACAVSPTTVGHYLGRAQGSGLDWEALRALGIFGVRGYLGSGMQDCKMRI
jgi:response regulator of citrate/malate metabolism